MILDRFPDRSEHLLYLYQNDDNIRHICDDMIMAVKTLHDFERRVDGDHAREIEDFRQVIAELDSELIAAVDQRSGEDRF